MVVGGGVEEGGLVTVVGGGGLEKGVFKSFTL